MASCQAAMLPLAPSVSGTVPRVACTTCTVRAGLPAGAPASAALAADLPLGTAARCIIQ